MDEKAGGGRRLRWDTVWGLVVVGYACGQRVGAAILENCLKKWKAILGLSLHVELCIRVLLGPNPIILKSC